ncbi:TPA: DUF551 domain-containing protein [Klebsiella pneumoniae]|uniref:DUF551 domain-containing protein n=2 Tax=Klebsiella pneumoniae TaxID=573 RepID=UPI001785F986|nr:DUF551 domain-containing protein [Klebsiella pneumoniae]MBD8433693.1 DUF551 domain-containing protein [Klebsiella pneumoniae]MCA4104358.1 DUF551 domain-containing protein [Klebsiella pneumoniae]HBQ1207011.1 DUF551 domain-containing protein [Klebsiella pneumoniae]HBY2136888.1 DUF551 domain-containing protein [Klebsiella pneumoniae]HBY2148140.1 DUF551 domain-containing protein [Klebsiella pneumoniae]
MTSKLSRDRLQEIAEDGFLKHGESKALARMALAAMDSEPVALQPELAKVIYHFRDWNEGFPVERFKADYVISWMLANYPPAPPAPVVSADLLHTAASAIEDLLTTKDRTGAGVWFDLPFRLRSAANAQPAPVSLTEAQVAALEEEEKSCHDGIRKCIASLRYHHKRAEAHSTGYKGSTLEDDTLKSINFLKRNIIAAMFRAEPVTTANKLGNSPVQSDCCPAQNQGWIPVSEQMPDNTEPVLCIEKRADFGTYGQPFVCWHDGGGWVGKTNYRPIVTHWMPLPAAPQEVKGE